MSRKVSLNASIRPRNPIAKALRNGALRPQIVKSKRIYKRYKCNNVKSLTLD